MGELATRWFQKAHPVAVWRTDQRRQLWKQESIHLVKKFTNFWTEEVAVGIRKRQRIVDILAGKWPGLEAHLDEQ